MQNPEQLARQKIDRLLTEAGWVLQDRDAFDRNAALGVAVREFPLPAGFCDYLLFVGGKAAGVIEAKKTGVTLSGVADQSEKYALRPPEHLARWDEFLIYHYESTGEETFYRNLRDPKARSRRLFAFHRPETLYDWVRQPETIRARLRHMPPLDPNGLRDCQIEAITGLEESLAEDKPRSLIQLATGAGKTFTACSFSYRLIKEAGAKRILFLVDRNNLGDQTLREFQGFQPPGAANRFTDTYIVQHLHSHRIDPDAKVVITTIQRLYSMLRGQELSEEEEDASGFEKWQGEDGEPLPLAYNPDIPIETFDFIVTDECHRSIYGLWRQVLEYFDASIIGLTATPSKHTLGFFNQNLVAEYPYERSVADGVNVGYEIYRIRTRVTDEGGKVETDETGFQVPVRDKRTRKVRYEQLDADLEYTAKELDRSVVNPNQIRTVLQTYKDRVFTELFPDRTGEWLPKTLIFAKDDNHAEEIVHAVREVFGEGNDFAKKITYRKLSDPAKLKRVVSLIDKEGPWIGLQVDVKGEIYEGLLERNASEVKSGAGQYFTPRPVIEAIVKCVDPKIGETVCDPACGTGGFLLAAYDHMKTQTQDREKLRALRHTSFTGVDIVDEVVRLCAMNLYLHGIGNGGSPVVQGDALANDGGGRFKVVLTNPPFGKKSSYKVVGEDGTVSTERENYEREDFKFTTSNKQFNFLQHIMTILEANGRAGVVLPGSVAQIGC